jgi:hypothetical protein
MAIALLWLVLDGWTSRQIDEDNELHFSSYAMCRPLELVPTARSLRSCRKVRLVGAVLRIAPVCAKSIASMSRSPRFGWLELLGMLVEKFEKFPQCALDRFKMLSVRTGCD